MDAPSKKPVFSAKNTRMRNYLLKTFPFLTLLLLSACADDSTTDSMLYLATQSQVQCRNNSVRGTEILLDFREMMSDRSIPEISTRIKNIYSHACRIDSLTGIAFQQLEVLKKDLLLEIGESKSCIQKANPKGLLREAYDPESPLYTAHYELFKVSYRGTTDFLAYDAENGKQIRKLMETYRHFLVSGVVASMPSGENYPPFFFQDPQIRDFKDWKDLHEQLNEAIETSHVALDDKEAVRQLYSQLSLNNEKWKQALAPDCSWATVFEMLTWCQSLILEVRESALKIIWSRTSCCENYNFNKIAVLATGEPIVKVNQPLEFAVFMGAYYSFSTPIVTSENAEVLPVKDGQGRLRIVPNKTGEVILKGTITLKGYSGVSKTMPWTKKVLVVQ